MNLFEVKKKLLELWPKLKDIWVWDRQYYPLTEEELREYSDIVRKTKIVFPDGTEVTFGKLMNSGDYWDCDNFSAGGDFITKLWAKLEAEKGKIPRFPIAYGRAMGSRFRSKKEFHALNFALTVDGFYFVDHDDGGKTWKGNPEQDSIFFASV